MPELFSPVVRGDHGCDERFQDEGMALRPELKKQSDIPGRFIRLFHRHAGAAVLEPPAETCPPSA